MYGAWDNVLLKGMLMELHRFTQMSKFGLKSFIFINFQEFELEAGVGQRLFVGTRPAQSTLIEV